MMSHMNAAILRRSKLRQTKAAASCRTPKNVIVIAKGGARWKVKMRLPLGVLAVALFASQLAGEEFPLKAGVARIEITPSESMPMYGYSNRKCGPANGTHDPLFAKVLVLAAGDARVAIVTLDLGSFVSGVVHREASEKLAIPLVLLAASHTHSAPQFPMGADGSPYREATERKILDAIQEASKSMFPARLSVGRGSIQLGYNRLLQR